MLATAVDQIPEGPDWAYEPKWDGWRAIAYRQPDRVHLQSRTGKNLSTYFPDVTRILQASLPAGVVLDGELLIWERDPARTNFALLQQRITAGAQLLRRVRENPAYFVAFDLLADATGGLLETPLAQRRERLRALLADAPVQLPLCPQTTDPAVARDWMAAWTAAGIEGVVAKRLSGRYEPGRRGWRKVRARSTTEAVVGGVTGTLTEPETVLLGRLDTGARLRYTGRSHPLSTWQRRELAALLRRAPQHRRGGVDHPWPQPLPAVWSGQLDRPDPLPYVQVEPAVVAEISVDTAFEHRRWRHAVHYLRPRPDLSVYDVPPLTSDQP